MYKYTVLECKECKHREMYPSNTADGHKCKVCGSTIYIPIDTGLKAEMQCRYNIGYDPRSGRDVTVTEYELLLKRFRHLMKSKTIASYDEVDPKTKEYKRDIEELDRKHSRQSRTIAETTIMLDLDEDLINKISTGLRLVDALSWSKGSASCDSILASEEGTKDILIKESDLMKLIQMLQRNTRGILD